MTGAKMNYHAFGVRARRDVESSASQTLHCIKHVAKRRIFGGYGKQAAAHGYFGRSRRHVFQGWWRWRNRRWYSRYLDLLNRRRDLDGSFGFVDRRRCRGIRGKPPKDHSA